MRRTLGVLLVLMLTASLRGQDGAPPLAAPEDFSHIVGRYRIATSAAPIELRVEDPLTLTVRIIGSGPAEYQPRRDKLHLFPDELSQDFYVEPLPEKDGRNNDIWAFAYRLKPKRTDVKQVPALKLVYYSGRKFQTSFSEPIALKVSPRSVAENPAAVKDALKPPPQFYELITGDDEVLRREQPGWLFQEMVVIPMLLVPPLLCAGWYVWWRRRHPAAAALTRRARSEAAERALRDLRSEIDPADIAARVIDYLRQRLDLPGAEPTPLEVRDFLWRAGVARTLRDRFASFFAACDAGRFAPMAKTESLVEDACQLIRALEGETCGA